MTGTHIDGPGIPVLHREDYAEPRSLTHMGRWVNPCDPNPHDILIEDIAYALSHQARYNGMHGPYSVAQHSVLVSYVGDGCRCPGGDACGGFFCSDPFGMAKLLHDAPEAYIGDMAHPIKYGMPALGEAFRAVEAVVAARVEEAFGLPHGALDSPPVKDADRKVFKREWAGIVLEHEEFEVWDSDESYRRFLARFDALAST